ncbi:Uncharacterised protein [Pseudomonas aeruginosa]|nr:Uncharacterised protein [Pseudomonas aeruginosa]
MKKAAPMSHERQWNLRGERSLPRLAIRGFSVGTVFMELLRPACVYG